MSMFAKLFGGGKKQDPAPAKPAQPAAKPRAADGGGQGPAGGTGSTRVINRMEDTIEAMDARERQLQKKIDAETQKAKDAMAKKNKNLALLCMKRKKLYEDNLGKLMAQRANMETIKITMEDTAMNAEVLRAQRDATNEMERVNQTMDADRVEDDMDRMRDAMDDQQRIADMLGQPIGPDVVDEDDLMDDLELMMAEDRKEKSKAEKAAAKKQPAVAAPAQPLPDMGPSVSKLPEPAAPAAKEDPVDEDEEELRKLEAEMGIA